LAPTSFGQHIAFQHLTNEEHTDHQQDRCPDRPELRNRHQGRHQEAGQGTEVRDEAQQPRHQPDHCAEVEAGQRQRDRVKQGKRKTDDRLAAHEAGDGIIDIARQSANRLAVRQRNPSIDGGDHAIPIAQEIERHDRRDDQQ
jgi:hypothetical protein